MASVVAEAPQILSMEDFLQRYPWPEDLPSGAKLEWLFHYDLDTKAELLWPYLIDTSRLNRALGLAKMEFEEREGILHGESRAGGVLQQWVEMPWAWNFGRDVVVVRVYSRGFARYVRGIYLIEKLSEDRIRVYVYFGWIPRNFLYGWAIKLGMGSLGASYGKALRSIAADVAKGKPEIYRVKAPALDVAQKARLTDLVGALLESGQPPELVRQLASLIEHGDDLDVDRIQPLRLAREWNVDARALLSACLHATRAGLLELSWDIVCPLCRGTRVETTELSGVPKDASCDVCDVEFGTGDEHALEVTFHAHPGVREVPKLFYCSAEPATRQHIKLQLDVAAASSRLAPTSLPPGRYRLRTLGSEVYRYLEIGDDYGEKAATINIAKLADARLAVAPTLRLENPSDEKHMVVVEDTTWADDALRPGNLFGFQDFRDLFSEDYVAADVQLAVGYQTIFFSDIVGSTRFYDEVGDPGAFVKVREHFNAVFETIKEHRGAVVKTIGDAVMATFPDCLDAIRASEAVHNVFDGKGGNGIRLRISLHAGPCIAVNLNSRIDYFGGTVNLAAKLQACAEAGEVGISDMVYGAPGVADYLAGATVVEKDLHVKALNRTVRAYRWDVTPSASS